MARQVLTDGGAEGALIGQSATDLLGFYGLTTSVAQPAAIADAADAAGAITQCNAVIAALEALGLIAS